MPNLITEGGKGVWKQTKSDNVILCERHDLGESRNVVIMYLYFTHTSVCLPKLGYLGYWVVGIRGNFL